MIRPPPRSTLFPYPPLFRSQGMLRSMCHVRDITLLLPMLLVAGVLGCGTTPKPPETRRLSPPLATVADTAVILPIDAARSEEHTSELQSRLHLVCRLLLEKK